MPRLSSAWMASTETASGALKHRQQYATTPAAHASATAQTSRKQQQGHQKSGRQTVEQFYTCYNAGDVDGLMQLFAEDCEYHDMIYAQPFKGHEAVRAFFTKCGQIIPSDCKFAIDAITDGDSRCVGVKWHLDLAGNEFPFSRGVSFYELDDQGRILRARDIVESAIKPGGVALRAIGLVTPLIRKLGPAASPDNLNKYPPAAIGMWGFYAVYVGLVLASSALPGNPAYAIDITTLKEVFHNSINFFYVNQILNWVGIHVIESIPEHPVGEAVFNFVLAWNLMLWPLMLADPKGQKVKNKLPLFIGSEFLTNIFFVPYMALREQAPGTFGTVSEEEANKRKPALPSYTKAIAVTAAVVGVTSIVWALAVRPEYGGLADRWQWTVARAQDNRVFFAFVLDAVLYSVWQAVLVPATAPSWQKYVPFAGLVGYLLQAKTEPSKQQ